MLVQILALFEDLLLIDNFILLSFYKYSLNFIFNSYNIHIYIVMIDDLLHSIHYRLTFGYFSHNFSNLISSLMYYMIIH